MVKQFELIPIESNNVTAEVAVKKSPLLRVLKYALVGITVFIALVILFAVGASVINPAVDGFAQKLGLGEEIVVAETSPVAYAWTNPSPNTGDTGISRVASASNFNWNVQSQQNTLKPETNHNGWNWGYYYESGNGGATIGTDGGVSTNNKNEFKLQTMFYVDIYLDDAARQAIANGQIKTCNVTLAAYKVGTANVGLNRGTINGTFFLCASTTGSSSASAHDMGTSPSGYYYTGTACPNDDGGTGDWFNDCVYWARHDYTSNNMSITLKSDMRKIRFGIYYRIQKNGSATNVEVFAPCPTIVSNFTTDSYNNAKIQFAVNGGDGLCNITKPSSSTAYPGNTILNTWSGEATYDSTTTNLGGVVVGDVVAKAEPGYFFSGWKIEGGTISGVNAAAQRSTTLTIGGGPYLKGGVTTTITAYFRKIEITGGDILEYIYKQENNNGNVVLDSNGLPKEEGQGPSAVTPASNNDTGVGTVSFVLVGGVYDATSPTFSSNGNKYQSTDAVVSWKSNDKPTDAGQYRFMVGVFVSGKENSNENVLGYYISDVFDIKPLTIPAGTVGTSDINSREYAGGNAYKPTPTAINITVDGRAYQLRNETIGSLKINDYDITSYENNYNVGDDAYLRVTAKGNFTGQPTVFFSITHLNINDEKNAFSVVGGMASEIQSKYGLVYDGFGQRPDVVCLKITGKVFAEGNATTKTDANMETKEIIIYVQTKDNATYYNDNCTKYGYETVTINADLNYFYIVGRDTGTIDPHSVYDNNINAGEKTASFGVELIKDASNMYGSLTVPFSIGELDLDDDAVKKKITKVYDQTKEETYTSKEIIPVPDVVYVSVQGLNPFLWNETNQTYLQNASAVVTFAFTRNGATVTLDESIAGTTGNAFTASNAYFAQEQFANKDATNKLTAYADNVNVAYKDGGNTANVEDVIAKASIKVTLANNGNVTGTITTLFKINPRNLNQDRSEINAESSGKVGIIVSTGENLIAYYQGVDENGNHIPVEPTSKVKAYPDGTGTEYELKEQDVYFTYSNNTTVTRDAKIIANGRGNYTGSITGSFYILAMVVSGQDFAVSNLPSIEYTGHAITPSPDTLTASVNGVDVTLRKGFDYIIDTNYGNNQVVYTGNETSKMAYITINLTGFGIGDEDKGTAVQGTGGNYYGKGIKVYFNITPKDIGNSDIIKYANWKNHQSEVTYTGAQIKPSTITTNNNDNRDENTLYLCDTTANANALLVWYTKETGVGDYEIVRWGENINAGDDAGSVTIQGMGNYRGECTITFKIYTRNIETNKNNIEISFDGEHEYTGKLIEAKVYSVTDSGITTEGIAKELEEGVDYKIVYGDGKAYDESKLNLNYDVLAGGTITIQGIGNYSGSITKNFKITPIEQSVTLESPYGNGYNSSLVKETKATDKSKSIYADYEINVTENNTITVVGYTNAIFPLRRLTFKLVNISGTTAGNTSVSYDKVELVQHDGKDMAKTTATIVFTSSGIVRIYAEQYDDTIANGALTSSGTVGTGDREKTYFNRGNYKNYTYSAEKDTIYSIYAKNADAFSKSFVKEYSKVYGNEEFAITPGLTSYSILSKALDDYSVVSNNEDTCRIEGTYGIDRTAYVGIVGTATITISHSGYVPQEGEDDANAYVAFSGTVTVNVAKRSLIISFAPLTVEYGTTPTFLLNKPNATEELKPGQTYYTYTTNGQGIDNYTSLTYKDRTDDINRIIQKFYADYSINAHGAVRTEPYTISVKAPAANDFNSNVDKWDLYNNYTISYQPSLLTVVKKELVISATNIQGGDGENRIEKIYGQENPTNYTIGYEGLVNGEQVGQLTAGTGFKAPSLDYEGKFGNDKVTQFSPVKEYNVLLTGGYSANYTFKEVIVTVQVKPALATISIGFTNNGSFNESITGNILTKDYDTKTFKLDNDHVRIQGYKEDGTLYDVEGKLSYKYSSEYSDNAVPQLAGTYAVQITFTPSESETNYAETKARFDGVIIINKVAPNINVAKAFVDYTGSPIPDDKINVSITRIVVGDTDGNEVANKYPERVLFKKDPSVEYLPNFIAPDEDGKNPALVKNFDESYYTTTTPTEKGEYDVIVVYRANADDQAYCSAIKYFPARIVIQAGSPNIVINTDAINRVYDGLAHGYSTYDFDVTYQGSNYDSYGTETIWYSRTSNDDDWTLDAPINAGSYYVKVEFKPVDDAPVGKAIYTSDEPIINIAPFDLATPGYISVVLEGLTSGWHVYGYDAKEHKLKDTEFIVKGVYADEQAGKKPNGTISVTYYNKNTRQEESAPKNVGTYQVRVTYNQALEGANNYWASSAVAIDKDVVQINTAEVVIKDVQTTKTENYTGRAVTMGTVYFHGVETAPGKYDQPAGSLAYEYRMSGSSQWSKDAPINVGKYDVMVSYKGVANDNYYNANAKIFVGAIEIKPVLPSIIINPVTFDYGEEIIPSYSIIGAQADENGPMNAVDAGIAVVVVEYGTRYVSSSTGKIEYEWSETKPTASGKYSIKVTYYVLQSGSSNYSTNLVTQPDVLTINNIKPYFTLETKVTSYSGARINASQAKIFGSDSYDIEYVKWYEGIDEDVSCYYGTIGYEYSKSGMNEWSPIAPYEVGVYDVRVRYYANSRNDVFKSDTMVFAQALKIEQVVITVMPLYGQGYVYDGSYTSGDAVAYVYSYVLNGYKYLVYSTVSTAGSKEIVDISSAEYVDENGFVYNVITDTSLKAKAWRDYYTTELTLLTGSFVDGSDKVEFNYTDLGDTEGKVSFSAGGKEYVIDLDRGIVHLNDGIEYTLGVQHDGYYFSIVNGEGAVNVISIDVSKIVSGIYNITTGGQTKSYKVDLDAKKVTDENGNVYDVYNTVGIISYEQDGRAMSIMVDHASYYSVSEDGVAIYKHASGGAYLIDLNTSKVEKVAVLTTETASFVYYDYLGAETTFSFNVSELRSIYSSNAYVGRIEIREGYNAIVNLTEKSVRLQTYYALKANSGSLYSFIDANGEEDMFSLDQLIATEQENVYLYYSPYLEDYYVDFNAMTVKNVKNLFEFDATNSKISQEIGGITTSFDVDVRDFTYNVTKNGRLYGVTKLFGSEYEVKKTTLIAGNEWKGSMSLGVQDAGAHEIKVGSLVIGANYEIIFVDGVKFIIDRAPISIIFDAIDDEEYNGRSKTVGYDVEGLVEGETKDVISVKQEYDGDTVNVTDAGYRAKITVTALNYYVIDGIMSSEGESIVYSDYYYITPAEMAPITFVRGEDIVYDGLKHYLELKNVERGAKVTYSGSTTAPYFREPGIYSVIATVSKENYVSQEVELTMVIAKAKYQVNVFEVPGTLTYGDALPALRCDSQEGTVALDPGQILLPNVTTYTWTFTPYDQSFYKYYEGNSSNGNTITGTIELKVNKAQANIEISGDLVQSETSPSAIVGIANGLTHNESELVTIEYIAPDGTRYAKMPTEAGKYTIVVTYAGDEYHAETVYTTTLTIEAESNYDWLIIIGGVLLGLTLLSTVFFLVRRGKKIE